MCQRSAAGETAAELVVGGGGEPVADDGLVHGRTTLGQRDARSAVEDHAVLELVEVGATSGQARPRGVVGDHRVTSAHSTPARRSEERRVGNEGGSTCRTRW